MVCHIEACQEASGGWIAKVPAVPGLRVYGGTQRETLAAARKLSIILLPVSGRRRARILGFYPGRIPDSARLVAQPLDTLPARLAL